MAVKRAAGTMSCVEAAFQRVRNVFANGVRVYLSLSGGKDSICLADIVYQLIRRGEADPARLTCVFIDEEAIYDCSIQAMETWRKRFLLVGAKFDWYCLPFKQVSCFNQLQNTESWITWEPGKEDVWVRQPPPFAIRSSPYLSRVGEMNYQTFLPRVCRDGIMLTGVRASESVQRLQYMSQLNLGRQGITGKNMIYPIYDWKDADVWLYLRENNLDFPEAYIWIWQAGESKSALRISNFFGSDSIRGLKHVAETDPELWARIEKREPNAYLVLLYWDSEWYKRNSRTRRTNEAEDRRDYKELTRRMLFDEPEKHFTNGSAVKVANQYRRAFVKADGIAQPKHYRQMHDALVAGDPKLRSLRAIYQNIFGDYFARAKAFRKGGGAHG